MTFHESESTEAAFPTSSSASSSQWNHEDNGQFNENVQPYRDRQNEQNVTYKFNEVKG